MRALSVRWPWCGLIAAGLKPFEIRSWRTKHRGPLLICSSGSPSRDADARRVHVSYAPIGIDAKPVLGVAMCLVDLVDVRPFVEQDAEGAWCRPCGAPNEYVWELRNVRTVARIAVKGRLGFYDVNDADVIERAYPAVTARLRDY